MDISCSAFKKATKEIKRNTVDEKQQEGKEKTNPILPSSAIVYNANIFKTLTF
jgi:hypothetical protein